MAEKNASIPLRLPAVGRGKINYIAHYSSGHFCQLFQKMLRNKSVFATRSSRLTAGWTSKKSKLICLSVRPCVRESHFSRAEFFPLTQDSLKWSVNPSSSLSLSLFPSLPCFVGECIYISFPSFLISSEESASVCVFFLQQSNVLGNEASCMQSAHSGPVELVCPSQI